MTKMDPIEKDFTELFVNMGKTYGMNDVAMKIIGLVYLSKEDISMDEISKKTGYSLATISNNCKILFNTGILNKIKKPGTKKIFLNMDKDLVKLNIKKMEVALDYMIKPMKLKVNSLLDKYNQKNKTKEDKTKEKTVPKKNTKEKIDLIKNYERQVEEMEEIMVKWKKDLEKVRR